MNWAEAIPFLISAFLLLLCILFYLYDQKKFKQRVEDDMQRWFEEEYHKGLKNLDRRESGRIGGRRAADKLERPHGNTPE